MTADDETNRLLLLIALSLAACSTATAPTPSPSPTVCPSHAIVQSYLAAAQRFDGVAAAAFFTPDGFIETPVVDSNRGGMVQARFAGVGIPGAVGNPNIREREITRALQGCDAVVTWGQRNLYVSVAPPLDLRATATLRDGKTASIVYVQGAP